jgi:hypothetical protein
VSSSDRPPPKARRSNEEPIVKSGEIQVPDPNKTLPAEFGIELEGFENDPIEEEVTRPGEKIDTDVAVVVARVPKEDDTPVTPIKPAPPPPLPA